MRRGSGTGLMIFEMKYAWIFVILCALTACENVDRDLYDQITIRAQEKIRLKVPIGATPVTGRPVDYTLVDPATLKAPSTLGKTGAEKGSTLFDRYCRPCHGNDGKAGTKIGAKMDVPPVDLTGEDIRVLTDGEIFVKIIASDSLMPNFRAELEDNEAWEIVHYVRTLQEAP